MGGTMNKTDILQDPLSQALEAIGRLVRDGKNSRSVDDRPCEVVQGNGLCPEIADRRGERA